MDWILEHLQLLLVIAGAVAYWLNQRRREQAGDSADYDGDGIPEKRPVAPGADALEEEDRTRRIQEEIRRKILERRGGAAPAPEPPPLPAPVEEPFFMPPLREERPEPVRPSPEEEILARQRALQERLEALKARRAAAARMRPAEVAPAIVPVDVLVVRPQHALLAELRDPSSVRRAIVLREVLGPPVALR